MTSLELQHGTQTARSENRLGVLYAKHGRYKDAEFHFATAVELDSAYGPAWVNLGHIASLTGNYEQAVTYYLSVQELGVGTVTFFSAFAYAYRAIGDSDAADAMTRQAMETE